MKKTTLLLMLIFTSYLSAQCLTSTNGQWPTATYTPAVCDGVTANTITAAGFASEYSRVNVVTGQTYVFKSSIATDYLTVGTADGTTALAFAENASLTWISTVTGVIRIYLHTNPNCGGNQTTRTRSVICGTPPSCIPPGTVTAPNVTDSTATISWIASSSAPSEGYEYVLSTVNTPPTVPTDDVPAGTLSVSLTELTQLTPYYFWVRANCGNGDYSTWKAFSFTTTAPAQNCATSTVVANCDENVVAAIPAGAGAWNVATCGFSTLGSELIYSYTPAQSGLHKLQIVSSTGGYVDYFYKAAGGTCDATGWTCIGDANGAETNNIGNLTAGTEYWILLDSENTSAKNVTFKITCPPSCTNGVATYTVVSDCDNGPQFNVDVAITDMGTGVSYTIADDQGSAPLQLTALGTVQFGPYPNGISVIFTVTNDNDATCVLTSPARTQTVCPPSCANAEVIASCNEEIPVTLVGAGAWSLTTCGFSTPGAEKLYSFTPEETGVYDLEIISSTGGYVDYFYKEASGTCNATGWICIGDANGAEINDIGTLNAGTEYLILVDSESTAQRDIVFKIKCLPTCTNGTATYTVVSDCANGEQFNVDVAVTNMGSAVSYTISDDLGSAPQQLSALGTVQFGPYPNGIPVIFTVANDDDETCVLTSPARTQAVCPPNCADAEVITSCGEDIELSLVGAGAWSIATCGFTTPGAEKLYSFTPEETGVYDLEIVSSTGGYVDYFYKQASGTCDATGWTCIGDANGAEINDIGTLTAGTEYLILIDSESATQRNITFRINCLPTCTNGTATYTVVSDCTEGEQFKVDVAVTNMGSATSYTITDDMGSVPLHLSQLGTVQFGPYPNGVSVIFTVANDDDETCVLTSAAMTQSVCPPNCQTADVIASCDQNVSVVLAGAGVWSLTTCGFSTPGAEKLYRFTPAVTGIYSLQIVSSTGGYVDYFYKQASGACNATGWQCIGDANGPEINEIGNLTAGTEYLILVDIESAAQRNITFKILCPPTPAENDSCDTATPVNTFPYTASINASGATNNGGFIASCSAYGGMNDGVWFTVVGDGSDITIEATSVGWDGQLDVYTGACGAFVCVGSADENPEDEPEVYTIAASQVGVTYYINFGDYRPATDGQEGLIFMEITSETLGVDLDELNSFSYHPNPVKDILNLSYDKNITDVTVFNLIGQQVITKQIGSNQSKIDMSALPGGTYLVKVTAENLVKTLKIVKQ